MRRDGLVLCGGIQFHGELHEIHCDAETGELVYTMEDAGVNYAIGEVTVTDPVTLPSVTALRAVLDKFDLMGVVYTKAGALVILDEYVAEWRPVTAVGIPNGQTVAIDTMIEVEFDEE